jgi:hypothetical protein
VLYPEKKKGPLAMASGPSLGRKRPRRAAIAQGATAPQQYATALHKTQVVFVAFPMQISKAWQNCNRTSPFIYLFFFNHLSQINRLVTAFVAKALDFVINCGNDEFARLAARFSIENATR